MVSFPAYVPIHGLLQSVIITQWHQRTPCGLSTVLAPLCHLAYSSHEPHKACYPCIREDRNEVSGHVLDHGHYLVNR